MTRVSLNVVSSPVRPDSPDRLTLPCPCPCRSNLQPACPLVGLSHDVFTRFGSTPTPPITLRADPVYKRLGLTPSVATHADLDDLVAFNLAYARHDTAGVATTLSQMLSGMDELAIKDYMRGYLRHLSLPDGMSFEDIWPGVYAMFSKPGGPDLSGLEKGVDDNTTRLMARHLTERFLDNPQGDLLLLRDQAGQVVAVEGVNQFQMTHEQLSIGNAEGIHPKAALLSSLVVAPGFQGQGIGTALKKSVLDWAHRAKGYRYAFSATAAGNASDHINFTHLGYRPLTEETVFSDMPVFTPAVNRQLLANYNKGTMRLGWTDMTQLAL
ncbi:MAG: GNAT family N-acetyltransferase [Cyanobacteria bacterium HKST-UBA06]|nr:GNAT family N-acetyltransferase [Cyanobacteria bacterium HKST-UBA06]MCA9841596.1 GNAT family N-acetyltransferase [Cyanobacteria bacterium HKST-UBA03]